MKNTIKTTIGLILAFLATISANGCRLDEYLPEAATPFEIVVLSDIHLRLPGYPDDVFFDNQRNLANILLSVDLINETYAHADFVAVTGDLLGSLFSEDPDDYLAGGDNPPERIRNIFNHLVLPYYITLGNHDYYVGFDPVSGGHIPTRSPESVEAVWKKVLGIDPYYSFIHKGVQMIFLNSNRGDSLFVPCNDFAMETLCMGSFDAQQMDWLEDCLRRPEPAIIFSHHPPVKDMDIIGSLIEDALFSSGMSIDINDRFYEIASSHKDKILAVFSGHWHMWREYTLFDTIKVYQTGPVGDYWSSGENMAIVAIDPVRKTVDVSRHRSSAYNTVFHPGFTGM